MCLTANGKSCSKRFCGYLHVLDFPSELINRAQVSYIYPLVLKSFGEGVFRIMFSKDILNGNIKLVKKGEKEIGNTSTSYLDFPSIFFPIRFRVNERIILKNSKWRYEKSFASDRKVLDFIKLDLFTFFFLSPYMSKSTSMS